MATSQRFSSVSNSTSSSGFSSNNLENTVHNSDSNQHFSPNWATLSFLDDSNDELEDVEVTKVAKNARHECLVFDIWHFYVIFACDKHQVNFTPTSSWTAATRPLSSPLAFPVQLFLLDPSLLPLRRLLENKKLLSICLHCFHLRKRCHSGF